MLFLTGVQGLAEFLTCCPSLGSPSLISKQIALSALCVKEAVSKTIT